MIEIRIRKQNEDVVIRQLVTNQCANYFRESDKILNYCVLETTETNQCIFFTNSEEQRCAYFEEAVLPLNKVLSAQYYDKHMIQTDMYFKKCENKKCKKPFLTSIKKDLFCSNDCKEDVVRLLAREKKKESE